MLQRCHRNPFRSRQSHDPSQVGISNMGENDDCRQWRTRAALNGRLEVADVVPEPGFCGSIELPLRPGAGHANASRDVSSAMPKHGTLKNMTSPGPARLRWFKALPSVCDLRRFRSNYRRFPVLDADAKIYLSQISSAWYSGCSWTMGKAEP